MMKTLRAVSLAGMTCMAPDGALAAASVNGNDVSGPVAEVAVYTVHDPEAYPAVFAEVMENVRKMPGIIGGVHLRSMNTPDLFADVYLWENLELAGQAAKTVETAPEYADFMKLFSDVKVFGHFRPGGDAAELRKFLEDGAAVELAVYSVKDKAVQNEPRAAVYEALRRTDVFRAGMQISPIGEENSYIDFIAWTSRDAAEKTAAAMMASVEHKKFFGNADKVSMFEFFTVYGHDGLAE